MNTKSKLVLKNICALCVFVLVNCNNEKENRGTLSSKASTNLDASKILKLSVDKEGRLSRLNEAGIQTQGELIIEIHNNSGHEISTPELYEDNVFFGVIGLNDDMPTLAGRGTRVPLPDNGPIEIDFKSKRGIRESSIILPDKKLTNPGKYLESP